MTGARESHGQFGSGRAVAAAVLVFWCLAMIYGAGLEGESVVRGFALGSASIFGVGLALSVPARTRRFGLGLAAGVITTDFFLMAVLVALLILVVGS